MVRLGVGLVGWGNVNVNLNKIGSINYAVEQRT